MFLKFDDGEVEIVVFMHVDDILAHAPSDDGEVHR